MVFPYYLEDRTKARCFYKNSVDLRRYIRNASVNLEEKRAFCLRVYKRKIKFLYMGKSTWVI